MGMGSGEMVVAEGLVRTYGSGAAAVHAVRDASFTVERGSFTALRGRSGAGKTTLLTMVGAMARPDAGRIAVDGVELAALAGRERNALRRDRIGFVFQGFGLVPMLSAAENVAVPLRLRRAERRERDERVALLLALVGLEGHEDQRPGELSGGQQQRVAVARALANRPALLVADEPTGQLDAGTGQSITALLRAVVRSEGVTALVATHDARVVAAADRVLTLHDGRIV